MGWRDHGDKQHLDKGKGFPEALSGGKLGLVSGGILLSALGAYGLV